MELIESYIIALTNLYGIVDKDRIVKTYNKQNNDKIFDIIIDDDNNIHLGKLSLSEEQLNKNFVYIEDTFFVHEAVYEYSGGPEALLIAKANKPYYIPKKADLLKFSDPYYHEITDQYTALYNYINNEMLENNSKLAASLSDEIYISIQCGVSMQELFDLFGERDVVIKDFSQAQELSHLITELINNTRIWENNGHTPREIFEQYEKPSLKPLPNKPFNISKPNLTVVRGSKRSAGMIPVPVAPGRNIRIVVIKNELTLVSSFDYMLSIF